MTPRLLSHETRKRDSRKDLRTALKPWRNDSLPLCHQPPPRSCPGLSVSEEGLWPGTTNLQRFVYSTRSEELKRSGSGIGSSFGNRRHLLVRFRGWPPRENNPLLDLGKPGRNQRGNQFLRTLVCLSYLERGRHFYACSASFFKTVFVGQWVCLVSW